MAAPIQNVVLIGADGKLGPAVLHALVSNSFNVTVLKHQSSTSQSNYPNRVTIKRLPDDFPVHELATSLRGIDAVVITIKGSQVDLQKRVAEACVHAKVQRLIPADFGSCDSSSALTQDLVPLYKRKTELRDHLMGLANQHKGFTWTSVVCGHFFDWSLEFIHIWIQERRADILNDGSTKFSISTLARIGEAVARILQKPDVTKNGVLFVQSFCVSQLEIIHAFESVTGVDWTVTAHDAEKWRETNKAKAEEGDLDAVEELVWYLGTMDADWRTKEEFAMKLLGLEDEDLNATVKRIVQNAQRGENLQ